MKKENNCLIFFFPIFFSLPGKWLWTEKRKICWSVQIFILFSFHQATSRLFFHLLKGKKRQRKRQWTDGPANEVLGRVCSSVLFLLSFPVARDERKGKCVGESLKKVSTSETTPNDTSKEREREWLGEKQTCAQPIPFPFLLFFGLTARKKRGRSVRLASYFLFFFLLASHTPSRERETGDRRQETDLRSGA